MELSMQKKESKVDLILNWSKDLFKLVQLQKSKILSDDQTYEH